jgi:RNA polymerase sigma-70 factor (ECF subfamily)
MQPEGPSEADAIERLRRAGPGGRQVLAELFGEHREALNRVVSQHLHPALRSRVDPADVLQEAYLQASAELPRYLSDPRLPFTVWLCTVALQKLRQLHRHHLGVQARDAGREVSLDSDAVPQDARGLAALPSPGEAALRAEAGARLRKALDRLETADHQVLTLRYFRMLSNQETAAVLGISEKAASHRHVRALLRLQRLLGAAAAE